MKSQFPAMTLEPAAPDPLSRRSTTCSDECVSALIVESAGFAVVVLNLECRSVTFSNRAARELCARIGCAIEYETLASLLAPPDGDIGRLESPFRPEPFKVGSRLIGFSLYRSRSVAWVFAQDLTDEARLVAVAGAVEMMNNIGMLFSALRHELGNPVNSLKAALSVLSGNIDVYSRDAVVEYLERMTYEVGRIEGLLKSMKSFSMYESLEQKTFDVGSVVGELLRLTRDEAERNGIEVTVAQEGDVLGVGDPRALLQVLLNILANATDAVLGRESPAVRFAISRSGDLAVIRVTDNGPGISHEQRAHLFRPFFTSKEHGTGLGLVISRKLMAKMGGTIDIASLFGLGAEVTITLPAGDASA